MKKIIEKNSDKISDLALGLGLTLMTAAVSVEVLGISHTKHEKAVPIKAESIVAGAHSELDSSAQRRESQEHSPHYVSYSAMQRTPSRAGKA
jgi:hypothetical protein